MTLHRVWNLWSHSNIEMDLIAGYGGMSDDDGSDEGPSSPGGGIKRTRDKMESENESSPAPKKQKTNNNNTNTSGSGSNNKHSNTKSELDGLTLPSNFDDICASSATRSSSMSTGVSKAPVPKDKPKKKSLVPPQLRYCDF